MIEDGLINHLAEIATSYYPKEFGGFLMGHYSDDRKTLFIVEHVLPTAFTHSSVSFERSTVGIEEAFLTLFDEKGVYYVGEWHSHPDGSTTFSGTDLNAMINTANWKTVQIVNPVLLIMSVSSRGLTDFAFYFFADNGLTPYE